MGIFGALTTSVAGLRANSYALENISGNIANSQTTAFKRIDTSFMDLIPDTGNNAQLAGSVTAGSRSTNTIQGSVQSASVATYMAINGDGFFTVQKPGGYTDNNPVFAGVDLYTRRGDFALDKNGYLVNGAGYFLEGVMIDPTTGNPSGSAPQVLQFQNDFLPSQATTTISYRVNLASIPKTTKYDSGTPGSELLDAASFTQDPRVGGAGKVLASETSLFLDRSISGGTTTAYDGTGTPVSVQLRWAKTASADPTAAPPVQDTWNLFYQTDPNAADPNATWVNAGQNFTFGANGQMSPPVSQLTLTALTIGGKSLGDVKMEFGAGGITQFADTNGNVQVNQLQQNGFAAGQLQSVSVSNQGRVVGSYSNGRNIDLAEVSIATFNGADFLKRIDGGAFEVTNESGNALYGKGGSISGSSLESSNSDIADEFTKLIVTQQAYSANTKVITTANTMVQDLLNVMR